MALYIHTAFVSKVTAGGSVVLMTFGQLSTSTHTLTLPVINGGGEVLLTLNK